MKKRQATPAQKAAAAERRAKIAALAGEIRKMTDSQRAQMAQQMPVVTIEGRCLSVFNQCLLTMQQGSVTVVGGFKQWRQSGRIVRKGERGLALWVPIGGAQEGEDTDTEENARPRFMLGTVFDVSQTDEIQAEAA